MAITKLSAVFGTGKLEKLTFASVDRSPHCTQMHYIMHEIERTLKEHVPVDNYVVVEDEIIYVPDRAIDLSKSLSTSNVILRYSNYNYSIILRNRGILS